MTSPVRALTDEFHERWLTANPFAASMYGVPGYDHLVPDASAAGDAAWRAVVEDVLNRAAELDGPDLPPDDAVTLGCLVDAAERDLLGLESAAVEYTVTAMPFAGPPALTAVAARTLLTDADACADYLSRLRGGATWLGQVTDRLYDGARKGRLPVARLVDQAIGWADSLLAEDVPTAFTTSRPPQGWDGAAAWQEERDTVVRDVLVPAMRRWVDTLRELRPQARDDEHAGLAHLAGGDVDYARDIRVHTTLPLTAEQIHQTGLDEVADLEERATALGKELGLDDLAAVFDALRTSADGVAPDDAIAAAVEAIRRAESRAHEVFPEPLPPPCVVTPMPSVIAASGMAPHYTPPRLDGARAGTYWFNTERPTAGVGWDLEGVAFHEAVPGHHLQLSRMQLLSDLPAMQRQRSLTVFAEGWGLYAEQLAEEMELYSDVRALLGALTTSLMRAARLVVDTGLHAFGWSRDQAVEFFVAHVPLARDFVEAEVDRYIVMPGQALAYLTGKLEILRLRGEARERLGDAFALPAFHAAVLDSGSLPMPVLAAHLDRWARSQLGQATTEP
jgi:uncharacterized protein (DUF885 family)